MRMGRVLAVVLFSAVTLSVATTADAAPVKYKNCTALNAVYKHGVGRKGAKDHTTGKPVTTFRVDNALYTANKTMDRDKDGIACEKK